MAVSAINQVPSPSVTFSLPVTSHLWGLALPWGQLALFHCQASPVAALPQHIPAPCPTQIIVWFPLLPVFPAPTGPSEALEFCRCPSAGLSCRADGAAVGCAVPHLPGSPCFALEGQNWLRDRTAGLEVTARAKFFVLLSSCFPCLGPAPVLNPTTESPWALQ